MYTRGSFCAHQLYKKYYAQVSDQEDLISIGTVGLIKGVSTFDPGKNVRLATYASRCVENEILMYFRSQKKSSQDVSLSDYIDSGNEGGELSLMDVVSQEDDNMLENLSRDQIVSQLRTVMREHLTAQEQEILSLRFGLGGEPPRRQREVAEIVGISRSYISRIEKRGLEKLKKALGG